METLQKKHRTRRAAEIEELPEEKQREMVFQVLLEQQTNTEWLRVFNVWRMVYGIVDEDKNPLFENEEDVMTCPAEAQAIFRRALDALALPVTEVKS